MLQLKQDPSHATLEKSPYVHCITIITLHSTEGKSLSKKALKKQQKEAEKAKRKADTAARLVSNDNGPSYQVT